jgi:beta-mannosidase
MNELKTEWVGEKSWTYKTTFDAPSVSCGAKSVLVFDGLDTAATIFSGGKPIAFANRLFR